MTPMPAANPVAAPGQSPPRRRASPRRRWLLLFNCQAQGLANALSLLGRGLEVTFEDTLTIGGRREEILEGIDGYERVLVAPGVESLFELGLGDRANVWRMPSLHFSGYHPDACVLAQDGPLSTGPLGLFHSALGYAAFRCGLDEEQATQLFCDRSYRALGYYERWNTDRDVVVANFRGSGFDIGPEFIGWSRRGPFMHTPNRPRIECLLDIARVVLRRAGIEPAETEFVPMDNLANGPVLPVYPELAARLGLRGSLLFKEEQRCALLDLQGYLEACFALYRACDESDASWPSFRPVIDRAIAYVGSLP